nr:hypothetical protein Iba_chr07fCG7300 [Ipomoea batatas]
MLAVVTAKREPGLREKTEAVEKEEIGGGGMLYDRDDGEAVYFPRFAIISVIEHPTTSNLLLLHCCHTGNKLHHAATLLHHLQPLPAAETTNGEASLLAIIARDPSVDVPPFSLSAQAPASPSPPPGVDVDDAISPARSPLCHCTSKMEAMKCEGGSWFGVSFEREKNRNREVGLVQKMTRE